MLKKIEKFVFVTLSSAMLGLSVPAFAANIIVDRDIDLVAGRVFDGPVFFIFAVLANVNQPRFDVSPGDTYTFNIRFLNNGSLTFRNIGGVFPTFLPLSSIAPGEIAPNTGVDSTAFVELLDSAGAAIRTSEPVSRTFPTPDFGYSLLSNSFLTVNFPPNSLVGSTTFFGIRVTGTVDSFSNPAFSSVPYDRLLLTIGLNDVQSAVPEPTTWVMMIAGFGIVGGAIRRRKHVGLPQLTR